MTSPTPTRCAIAAQVENNAFAPEGGAGMVRISANRECTWSAQSEAGWLTLTPPLNGQGDGSIPFAVAANGDPSARTTTIRVEDQRLQISQQARPCEFRLSATLETVDAAGGDRTIQVTASSPACGWTAVPQVPWITIASGRDGQGSGAVTFHVDTLSGPQRSGTITIAGQAVEVQQGAGCSYTVGMQTFSIGSAGGTGEVPVTAPPGCAWTSSSQVPWITLTSGATGSGPGTVGFRVASTDGPLRTGTLTVAGRVVTVTQSPGCSFTVAPQTVTAASSASSAVVAVTGVPGCGWTASSAVDWITIASGQTGNGSGEVRINVAANAGVARSGALTVAGQTVTVNQASGCSFTVNPTNFNVAAAGGQNTVQVTTAQGCAWTTSSTTSWIAVSETPGGSGSGQVQFAVAPNTGPARQGLVTVAGQNVAVSQASGCTYSVTPTSQDVSGGGGTVTASIATGAGCAWTSSSAADWITPSAGSGSGPAQVVLTVAANNGPARNGTATVANQPITINQASPCLWSFVPPFHLFGSGGGNGTILVFVTGPCAWTATSDVDWLSITAGASGSGNGLVQFIAAPNNGPARNGTLTIGGEKYQVRQDGR